MKTNIIQEGWEELRRETMKANVSAQTLSDMRNCFFAGALVLFAAIMTKLGPNEEPTDEDIALIEGIQKELDNFGEELKLKAAHERAS